jgi:hypothetical protein
VACSTSVQIYIKCGAREVFVPRVQIWLHITDFRSLKILLNT